MNKLYIYTSLLLFLLIASCAQQGSPSGGPKDELPPVVIVAEPENYSTNFDGKKIEITFNEFLDMGNFTQELVVSPPMEEKPIIKLKNKTLIIEFEEELKEDVTYTFNFGEGIKDLNEKNVLLNFEYVFSTGDRLDSLSVKGTLKNAFDLSIPEIPIFIMLYNQLQDSLPLTEIPYYVGRTDTEGNYAVNNLRADVYKLFVLKDGNNNFLFDLPTEEIAFLDSTVFVDANYFKNILLSSGEYDSSDFEPDTTTFAIDTVGLSIDSIQIVLDSVQLVKDSLKLLRPDANSVFIDLYMFTEKPDNQYLTDYSRKERRKMELIFNLPLTDTFTYTPIFPESLTENSFINKFGVNRDTLTIWTGDTTTAAYDTIRLCTNYTLKDSMFIPYTKHDTLQFVFKEKPSKNKGEANDKDQKKEKATSVLKINTLRNNGTQHINTDLFLSLDQPMKNVDPTKFEFYTIPDTVEIPQNILPQKDSSNLMRAFIKNKWEEGTKYRIILYPGAITNIYEETNDTLNINFTTSNVADYGKMLVNLSNVKEDPIIIQLYIKDKLAQERIVSDSGNYVFEYLKPETYSIKFIYDKNKNGKWDTGKYLDHLQPEKVEFVPNTIEVRANWDHKIEYTMGSNNEPIKKKESQQEEDQKSPIRSGQNSNSSTQLNQNNTSQSNSSSKTPLKLIK